MANKNPIQYTSRDFDSINSDINADSNLADKPNWFKRLIAGIGDVISMWLNATANDLYLRTAFTRQAVSDLCELIAYTLTAQTTSTGTILFYVDTSLGSAIYPFTVSSANLKAKNQGSLTLSSKTFQCRTSIVFTLVQSTFTTGFATNNKLAGLPDLANTGHKVRLTTSGTLPAPLQAGVDYYVIYVDSTHVYLAQSLADAYAGNQITLTSDGSGTQTLTLYSAAATCFQQDSITAQVPVGQSDGITAWQQFILSDKFILPNTLVVTINGVTWNQVTDFTDSTSVTKDYKVVPLSDNQFAIRFGDGTYGALPPASFDILVQYSFGGGENSNINVIGGINSYAGNDTHITGASNPSIFNGGSDEQSIDSAKNLAPLQIKVRDRFITPQDGQVLALGFGGLSLVKVIRNAFGVLSCQVIGIADGGGNPSGTVKTNLQQFLIDRTVLQSIDVRVQDATITSTNVTAAMHVLPNYLYANLLPYFRLALQLILTETGNQILQEFNNNGIAAATTLINSLLSQSFTSTDYNQIQIFLNNFTPRNFGDVINQSEVLAFVQSFLIGCDYLTIAAFGSGFPLVLGTAEITTVGVLTLSEITP